MGSDPARARSVVEPNVCQRLHDGEGQMGTSSLISAESVRDILALLDVSDADTFRNEFSELAATSPSLAEEDWSTEPELLEVLYCYIRAARPKTVVEIGTYKGTAAVVFHSALARNGAGRVITIDNNKAGTVPEARERFARYGAGHRITLLERSSNQAFVRWKRVPIELLYIDGAHSYVQACSDFALWSRFVSPDGLVVMHDTVYYLERRFPEDYIHPLHAYDVLHVATVRNRPSGHTWKGCGLIRAAKQS
jgi:predicted O-methyltransferase YrrM